MNLTQKVAWNTAVQGFGRFVAILISFVSVKLLTTRLGPAGYGEYAAILNYVSFFGVLADFGFFYILLRELATAKDRAHSNYIVGNILALRSIFAAIVLATAVIAIYLLPVGIVPILTPIVKTGIMVVALATFWQTLNSTFVAIFQAHYRMDRPVMTDIIGRAVSLVLLIPFLNQHLNVAWLVSAMVWGSLINIILNVIAARRYTDFNFKFDFKYWGVVWRDSIVLGLVSIMALAYFKIDSVILSAVKSSVDVGIYAAPYKIIEILNYFPAMFMGLVFTALVSSWKTDKNRSAVLINRSIEAMVLIALPVLTVGIILAKPIMQFISSADYAHYTTFTANLGGLSVPVNGIVILQILLLAVVIDAFGNIFGKGIIAFGSTKKLLWINAAALTLNVSLNLWAIPRWTYAGAAMTTLMTEAFVLVCQLVLITKYIKLEIPWQTVWRTLLAVIVLIAIIWPLRSANAAIGVSVGAAVYVFLVWKFKAVSPETVRLILKKE